MSSYNAGDNLLNGSKDSKASRYVSLIMALFLGAAVGVGGLYPMIRDVRSQLDSFMAATLITLADHDAYIGRSRVMQILPGANVRVTVLESAAINTKNVLERHEELLVILNDFRLEGGRFSIGDARELTKKWRYQVDTLSTEIDKIKHNDVKIEVRVEALEKRDVPHGKTK